MTVWYRYWDRNYSDGAYLSYSEYPVIRETEKSVWLRVYSEEKRVLKNARVRFAYPTKELAIDSYQQRKHRQVQHLRHQLEHAENCLTAAAGLTPEMTKGLNLAPRTMFEFSPALPCANPVNLASER